MCWMLSGVVPWFCKVAVCGALLVPTFCGAKFSCGGEIVTTVPVAVSSMTCGLVEARSVMEINPVTAPLTVG